MFCGVTSATCPLVDADAPLASDSDNPAAPKTGTVLLRRFRFEACLVRAISGSPILSTKQQAHRVLPGGPFVAESHYCGCFMGLVDCMYIPRRASRRI